MILCVKNYSSLFAAENTNCCLTLVINDCSIAFDVYDVSYNQYPVYCRKIGEGLDLSNSTFWFSHSNIQKKTKQVCWKQTSTYDDKVWIQIFIECDIARYWYSARLVLIISLSCRWSLMARWVRHKNALRFSSMYLFKTIAYLPFKLAKNKIMYVNLWQLQMLIQVC